ncbi:MAG: hypothetical protein JO190_02470 [Candidatus Eremiobacteraeota bacterium]|nr:hypothetical protein [Candidatus Eremiobacteraeota bacterium]MBV8498871.1 hypothetical protein [Candidatus Eremiobacteraeota bacterium]
MFGLFGGHIPVQAVKMLPGGGDPKLPREALLFQFILCAIGLVGGLIFLGLGVFLTVKGLTGSMTFGFKLPGISAQLSNAGPGLVVAVIGLMIVLASLYFYNVTFANDKSTKQPEQP